MTLMTFDQIVSRQPTVEPLNNRRRGGQNTSHPLTVAICIDTRDEAGRSRLYGIIQYSRHPKWRITLVRNRGKESAQEIARLKPDGIITYCADKWFLNFAKENAVPIVDTALAGFGSSMTVSTDNGAVSRLAVEHFRKMGLKNIGYIGIKNSVASEDRKMALRAQVSSKEILEYSECFAEGELNLEPLITWLSNLPKPVGLLAFDDKLGMRVLTACRMAGLAVPNKVAVLGVDNDQVVCELCWPPLSSVVTPHNRIGLEAARLLDLAMQGKRIEDPHQKIEPTEISIRGSTDMVMVEDSLVKSALQLIREQAGKVIGVEQVAALLKVSRRNLDRRFSIALGRTVHSEIASVRMQMACAYLADNSMKVASVAQACGFTTTASFSRSFRTNSGFWPSDYRDQVVKDQ
jgi:LacI family transcriptional regulator